MMSNLIRDLVDVIKANKVTSSVVLLFIAWIFLNLITRAFEDPVWLMRIVAFAVTFGLGFALAWEIKG